MVVASLDARIPMLKTLGRFAFVDDDQVYLDTLELTLDAHYGAAFFVAPGDFSKLEEALAQNRNLLRKEQAALLDVSRAQAGGESSQGFAAEWALRYFADPARLDMFIGLFTDYSMPVEDGVSLCVRNKMPGLQRTLLTGIADESKAIEAFNAGAIETYMPKGTNPLWGRILDQFGWQTAISGARRGELLESGVDPSLLAVLSNPRAADAIRTLLDHYGIAEYMVLGTPQGLLGITADGKAIWVQLETEATFKDLLATIRDSDHGWSKEAIERVARRQSIIDESFMITRMERKPTEQDAIVLCESPYLAAALFQLGDLPSELTPVVRGSPASRTRAAVR